MIQTTKRLEHSSLQVLEPAFVRRDESCFLPIQTDIRGGSLFLLKMKSSQGESREKSHKNISLLGKR
jgi:hypothetical protein